MNAYLANSIGNLLNRTQGLLKKNCSSMLPVAASSIPVDNPLRVITAEQVSALWMHGCSTRQCLHADFSVSMVKCGSLQKMLCSAPN